MAAPQDGSPERTLQRLRQLGDELRELVPERARPWIETGAALGALRTGTRVAAGLARRNPLLAVAAAAGAGLLLYAARRQALKARDGATAGRSRRIKARRVEARRDAAGKGRTTATEAATGKVVSAARARKTAQRRKPRTTGAE